MSLGILSFYSGRQSWPARKRYSTWCLHSVLPTAFLNWSLYDRSLLYVRVNMQIWSHRYVNRLTALSEGNRLLLPGEEPFLIILVTIHSQTCMGGSAEGSPWSYSQAVETSDDNSSLLLGQLANNCFSTNSVDFPISVTLSVLHARTLAIERCL